MYHISAYCGASFILMSCFPDMENHTFFDQQPWITIIFVAVESHGLSEQLMENSQNHPFHSLFWFRIPTTNATNLRTDHRSARFCEVCVATFRCVSVFWLVGWLVGCLVDPVLASFQLQQLLQRLYAELALDDLLVLKSIRKWCFTKDTTRTVGKDS